MLGEVRRDIKIGLIGMGTVGTGVAKILLEKKGLLELKVGVPLILEQAADRHLDRPRPVDLSGVKLTENPEDVVNNPKIDILVELIGGYEPARTFILKAISKGKHIVTANKALLATFGEEIFSAAYEKGVDIAFEASVGGGIPLIKGIKEGLVANNIECMFGILNGTANYILTKMTDEGITFGVALRDAQRRGYAEADPRFDVEGVDTAHKLAILTALAYGTPINLDQIYVEGISYITPLDIQFARELGYRIKLLAISRLRGKGIETRVHPTMIPESHLLANVNGAYNALLIKGDSVGDVLFYGLGAGMMPAGSAVVSDIVDLSRNLIKGGVQRVPALAYMPSGRKKKSVIPIDNLESCYYFRFSALDQPGVLAKIAGILGGYKISIASVIQKGRKIRGSVPIVMLTHRAKEAYVRQALKEIDELEVVRGKTVSIRMEDNLDAL